MDIPTPTISRSFSTPAPQKAPLGSFPAMPKRPGGGFNWFGTISFIIFFGVVCWWAGLFGYQYLINKEKGELEAQIAKLAGGLSVATFDNLEVLGNRLDFAQKIIDNHTALLPLLCFLEKNTLTKSVFYENFAYKANGGQGGQSLKNELTLSGRADSFGSLAYQAKVFEDEKAFTKFDFSGLSISETDGRVDFSASIGVGPDLIRYKGGDTAPCQTVKTATTTTT